MSFMLVLSILLQHCLVLLFLDESMPFSGSHLGGFRGLDVNNLTLVGDNREIVS